MDATEEAIQLTTELISEFRGYMTETTEVVMIYQIQQDNARFVQEKTWYKILEYHTKLQWKTFRAQMPMRMLMRKAATKNVWVAYRGSVANQIQKLDNLLAEISQIIRSIREDAVLFNEIKDKRIQKLLNNERGDKTRSERLLLQPMRQLKKEVERNHEASSSCANPRLQETEIYERVMRLVEYPQPQYVEPVSPGSATSELTFIAPEFDEDM